MLVLSRKIQEQIHFPSLNIRITVLKVGTNRVQLGIQAPSDIDVTRPQHGDRSVGFAGRAEAANLVNSGEFLTKNEDPTAMFTSLSRPLESVGSSLPMLEDGLHVV